MSRRVKSQTEVEQQVVDLVMQLIHELRSTRKITFNEMGRLYYKNVDDPDLTVERTLVQQIILLLRNNNHQISRRLIFSSLIGEVVGIVVFNYYSPILDDELEGMAREKVKALLEYSSTRDIDIPLTCLRVEGTPVRIGKVTFHAVTDEDKITEWWQKVKLNYAGDSETEVFSFGRVSSPGDWEISLDFAQAVVYETLLILRGIGFPFISDDVNQFGVVNEFPVWPNRPFRLHKALETIRIEGSSGVVTRIGPPIRIWRLNNDLLKDVDESIIENLNHLLIADNDLGLTKMQKKFLNGVRWIGEATKPDALPARYLKLATALEYLVGGEPNEEHLTTRGITATLAERTAFLIGKDQDHRLSIDREVRKYYGIRSEIVHGDRDEIDGTEFAKFGSLVRLIVFALCQKLSYFKNVNDLQKWVTRLRYS